LNPLNSPRRAKEKTTGGRERLNLQSSEVDMEALGFSLSIYSGSYPAFRSISETSHTTESFRSSSHASLSSERKSSDNNSKSSLSLSELLIVGRNSIIYSAQEIFGWKAHQQNQVKEASNPSSYEHEMRNGDSITSVTEIPTNQESNNSDEECVVCLTEKKDIALLPCRLVSQYIYSY